MILKEIIFVLFTFPFIILIWSLKLISFLADQLGTLFQYISDISFVYSDNIGRFFLNLFSALAGSDDQE